MRKVEVSWLKKKREQNSDVLEQQELTALSAPSFPPYQALENTQNCSLTEEYQLLPVTIKNLMNTVHAATRKKKGKVFSLLSNIRTYFL